MKDLLVPGILFLIIVSCSPGTKKEEKTTPADSAVSIFVKPFGTMKDGQAVSLFTMVNKKNVSVSVMNYGAIVTSIIVPDKNGVMEDIVLGYDSLAQYERSSPYFGAIVGRYGNRIAKGKFSLDGHVHILATNNDENHLHGGDKGFDKVFWNIEPISKGDNPSLKLTYLSKDGEEGYPGNLSVIAVYTLTEDNELKIEYTAMTDKKTVVNLTQHTYFNLSGNTRTDILGHELVLEADRFLPIDAGFIPTGEVKPVINTPFDFTKPMLIGTRVDSRDPQLISGKGYDHCWVLADKSKGLKKAAVLFDATGARQVEVLTTEPAIQFYSGNFLDGTLTGKYGVVYKHRYGLCLETEHYPDSPNHPLFPTTELSPGQTYRSTTVYKFSVR